MWGLYDGISARTLLLRGTRLGQRGDNGYVVVFDDVTHLIQAQRDFFGAHGFERIDAPGAQMDAAIAKAAAH